MFTESQLKRKTKWELAEIAFKFGLAEHNIYNFKGGPKRKEILIANIMDYEKKLIRT